VQNSWLTVDLVDDIQLSMQSNRSIDPMIKSLQNTTLPGFIQYKCLAWARDNHLPTLPHKIVDSEIAEAFRYVENHLQEGKIPAPIHIKTVACRGVEFSTISQREHLDFQAWNLFEARFNRSAQNVGFSECIANLMQAALHEMAENAVLHSDAMFPVIVAYHVLKGFAQFCVADLGIGVLESLRKCPDYRALHTHKDAIRKALQDGVSRFGHQRGGLGFRQVFKAVASQWGLLRFRSGECSIVIDGTDCDADRGSELFLPFLPGFQVAISCRVHHTNLSDPIM